MEFNKMIKEICDKNNIKCTFLSKNWVIKLEKDDMTRYITGNKFDLNGHALGNIMDDKYAFYEVMKDENIDIIEHKILYKNDNKNEYAKDCNSYEVALNYFYKNNCNIVLKSNCGACGNEVFHITDEKSLYETLDNLFINNFSISMCPFYKIKNEYRVIILDDEIKLIYGKINPKVIGDGFSTLKELLIKFNYSYYNNKAIKNENYIPSKGEEINYDFRFNLSQGSKIFLDIKEDIKKEITELTKKVTKTTGIRFSSIDIVELYDSSILVMEANSGVTINKACNFIDDGYDIAYKIYEQAIQKMFWRNYER